MINVTQETKVQPLDTDITNDLENLRANCFPSWMVSAKYIF